MSDRVIKSLEGKEANCRPIRALCSAHTYICRDSNHKTYNDLGLWFGRSACFSSVFSKLCELSSEAWDLSNKRVSTHIFKKSYRTLTHVFTVLSPMFSLAWVRVFERASFKAKELNHPASITITGSTALSPIKLPLFHTCTYRAFTHGSTVLSNMKFASVTVLSNMKIVSNLLEKNINLIRKVDLKVDYKKIISFVDDLFLNLKGKKRGYE